MQVPSCLPLLHSLSPHTLFFLYKSLVLHRGFSFTIAHFPLLGPLFLLISFGLSSILDHLVSALPWYSSSLPLQTLLPIPTPIKWFKSCQCFKLQCLACMLKLLSSFFSWFKNPHLYCIVLYLYPHFNLTQSYKLIFSFYFWSSASQCFHVQYCSGFTSAFTVPKFHIHLWISFRMQTASRNLYSLATCMKSLEHQSYNLDEILGIPALHCLDIHSL